MGGKRAQHSSDVSRYVTRGFQQEAGKMEGRIWPQGEPIDTYLSSTLHIIARKRGLACPPLYEAQYFLSFAPARQCDLWAGSFRRITEIFIILCPETFPTLHKSKQNGS